MMEKLQEGFFKLKTYWKRPPRGYDVSYKEFVAFALGGGGISFLSVIIQWTSLATSVHIMLSYFHLTTGQAWVLGIVAALIAIVRSPILSMIIDNSNSKKGKFKPFLLWTVIGSVICFAIIPYIPVSWNEVILFKFNLPAIPLVGIKEASVLEFSGGIIAMFVMLQIGGFFNTLLNQCMSGVEQTISTVAQERANMVSIKGLISNIPSSIINMMLPILAGSIFAKLGGWNSIEMYRIIFPICGIGAIIFVMFTVWGTKERVVVNKKYKAKVKFWAGAKELSKNKYFWIINIFNIAVTVRSLSNITTWITQYSFVTEPAKTIVGIYCTTLLMSILILGMVFGPVLIKKFGKRNVLIASNIGFALMVLFQFLVYKSPVGILIAALFQNAFAGVQFISVIMVSDILDYQQWKTGKRLEGFWQNYSVVITTIIGIFTGLLTPLFLSFGGISMMDDVKDALVDTVLREGAYKYQSLLALIGSVVAMIPIFFYDLTEKKHANYVRVLKIRAAVQNYNDKELSNKDVLNMKEILLYVDKTSDKFVQDELSKFDCIDEIVKDYDEVKVIVDNEIRKENISDFLRDIDLQFKRINSKLELVKKKANKKGEKINEEEFIINNKMKSRYLKYFVEGEWSVYDSVEKITDNIEMIYSELEKVWKTTAKETLDKNIAKEEIKMEEKLLKAQNKATAKGKSFDSEKFKENFIEKSKYIKFKE